MDVPPPARPAGGSVEVFWSAHLVTLHRIVDLFADGSPSRDQVGAGGEGLGLGVRVVAGCREAAEGVLVVAWACGGMARRYRSGVEGSEEHPGNTVRLSYADARGARASEGYRVRQACRRSTHRPGAVVGSQSSRARGRNCAAPLARRPWSGSPGHRSRSIVLLAKSLRAKIKQKWAAAGSVGGGRRREKESASCGRRLRADRRASRCAADDGQVAAVATLRARLAALRVRGRADARGEAARGSTAARRTRWWRGRPPSASCCRCRRGRDAALAIAPSTRRRNRRGGEQVVPHVDTPRHRRARLRGRPETACAATPILAYPARRTQRRRDGAALPMEPRRVSAHRAAEQMRVRRRRLRPRPRVDTGSPVTMVTPELARRRVLMMRARGRADIIRGRRRPADADGRDS